MIERTGDWCKRQVAAWQLRRNWQTLQIERGLETRLVQRRQRWGKIEEREL